MVHRILLADDSVTIQRVIELTFAGEDVEVLTAADGETAMARITQDRPDVVLVDVGLPGRSGYDVAAWMKAQPDLAGTPVVLLAGAFEPVDEARAREAGDGGVLVKPFEPRQVIARVRELLDRPVAIPAAPALAAPAAPRDPAIDDYFERLSDAFTAREQATGAAPAGDPPASGVPEPWIPTIDQLLASEAAPPVEEASREVADAFVALLAVEQGEPGARPPRLASADRRLSEALAARVTAQVMAQLSPESLRAAVTPLVSDLAARAARDAVTRMREPPASNVE